mmetsp:Transcript_36626/g.82814  ORF Transcript_36626/g.82814 Transcript_36626/m.82814 type:complete len:298 (+) Transcript_36626:177-1070(+)
MDHLLQFAGRDLRTGKLLSSHHLLVSHEDEEGFLLIVLVKVQLQGLLKYAAAASVVVYPRAHGLVVAEEQLYEDVVGAEDVSRSQIFHLPEVHLDRLEARRAPAVEAVAHLALEQRLVVDAKDQRDAVLECHGEREGDNHHQGRGELQQVPGQPPRQLQQRLHIVQRRPVWEPCDYQEHEAAVEQRDEEVEVWQPLLHPDGEPPRTAALEARAVAGETEEPHAGDAREEEDPALELCVDVYPGRKQLLQCRIVAHRRNGPLEVWAAGVVPQRPRPVPNRPAPAEPCRATLQAGRIRG